jgi:D-apionolactonase
MHLLSDLSGVSDDILLRGSETPLPALVSLNSGPFSLFYEAGNLRYIRIAGKEIIRMVYPALRGTSWEAYLPEISSEQIEAGADFFSISYQAVYRKGPVSFKAQVEILGDKSGRIIFRFMGEAETEFLKNRIGLCVLHPLDCAGVPVTLVHTDGTREQSQFPKLVVPNQPFMDVQSMLWNLSESVEISLDFTGDIFETEDQRNWADASYKTYSTPLAIPFPAKIKKGETIEQSVCIQATGGPQITPKPEKPDLISVLVEPESKFQLPLLGIGRPLQPEKLGDSELNLIKKMNLDHYRVELHFKDENWSQLFSTGNSEAKKLNLPLLMVLYFNQNPSAESKEFVEKCFDIFPQIEEIILFLEGRDASPHTLFDEVEALLREGLHHARIGVGTPFNFAEFNRNGPYPGKADFLAFSSNPQVHACDNRTLVENLQVYTSVVKTAVHNEGNRPIYVSPVSLKPLVSGKDTVVDPRQHSLFGAGWILGAIQHLAEAGTHAVSLFESCDELGTVGPGDKNSGNQVSPVFLMLSALLELRGFVVKTVSSDPLNLNALVCTAGNSTRVFLLNHSEKGISVRVEGISGNASWQVVDPGLLRSCRLDPDEFKKAPTQVVQLDASAIFSLSPFSIGIIDLAIAI